MEMTDRRLVLITLGVCGLLAALRLPPRGSSAMRWIPTWRSENPPLAYKLRSDITALNEVAVAIARRDTLLAVAHAQPSRSGPLVVERASLTPLNAKRVHEAVDSQATALGPAASQLVVGIVADTSTAIPTRTNYRTERQFILPAAADGQNCITLVRLGRGRRELDAEALRGVFGPCAFYAALGKPGPAVEQWLRLRKYDVAFDAVWPKDPKPNPSMMVLRKTTKEEDLKRWLDIDRGFRLPQLTACSAGDVDVCAKSMRTANTGQHTPLTDAIITETFTWIFDLPLGPAGDSYLADLLAAQGQAKFEKFWKGSGDLETAFRSAFGESTGEWTMRWMHYRYGRDTRGPMVTAHSAALTILACLTLVMICAVVAQRRESF